MVEQFAYTVRGWGLGELLLADGVVAWHELPATTSSPRRNHVLVDRVRGFLAGSRDTFEDVELDLEYETPFLESCARELRAVPRGEVVTYGELAALAGSPGAARAAGSFCARNRLGLFVPCHRVVSAGGLGSYGSYGLANNKRLLELEGVSL
jgi:methylated-DNA-[protein]-cysteine S-methyltransferase